jgi:hypothetical protein
VILPIVFFVLFFSRNRDGGYWVIFLYCILSLGADMSYRYPKTNAYSFYILSTFSIVEYSLFAYFLYASYKEKVFKIILLICSALFYTIAIMNITRGKTESFDSLSASLEASLLIIYSIFFLYEQIKDPTVFYVYYSKKFWIIIAILIYFSSTLFLFIYAVNLTRAQYKFYWSLNNLFDTLKNLLFAVSFAMKKNKQPKQPLESFYPDGN